MKRVFLGLALGSFIVLPIGCGTETPPTPTLPSTSNTGTGGSTLKVTAPTLVSPLAGQRLSNNQPTLVLQNVTAQFSTNAPVFYEFQVTTMTGQVVYSRIVAGGVANGQGTVSHTVATPLSANASYRWRARAVSGTDNGPFSNDPSGTAMFVTVGLSASSSTEEFRILFFDLIAQKGVGPTASAQALAVMEPDLVAVGIILEKTSGGVIRGRLYLPTGNPNNLFSRAVDIGSFGGPWQWVVRGSGTVCEGIC
jgi:hypothetical protein